MAHGIFFEKSSIKVFEKERGFLCSHGYNT